MVLGCALVAVAISLWTSLREPTTWESSTLVRVETRTADLFAPYQGSNSREDELDTEIRVIATTPVARAVVERLGLDFGVGAPPELRGQDIFGSVALGNVLPTRSYLVRRDDSGEYTLVGERQQDVAPLRRRFVAGEPVEMPGFEFSIASDTELESRGIRMPDEFTLVSRYVDDAVGLVLGGLQVTRPDPSASLIRVAYRGGDRYLVPRITDAVAEAFIEERTQVKKTTSRSTADVLREQVDDISVQLEAAENELQDFREEEQVLALDTEASTQVAQLAQMQSERMRLTAERDALRNLMGGIRGAAEGAGRRPDYRQLVAFPAFIANPTMQDLVNQLSQLETRRTELRARWTTSHPGIIAIDEQIAQVENRIGDIGNDYLWGLNDQIATHDATLARFGSDLARIPGKELQFARLERRVLLLTDLYSTLSQQLMQAEVSEAVEDPSARVIEPAVLPGAPVSPKPRRTAALAAFLGLVAGVGLAFVREQMDYTIRSDEDLDRVLGAPVLSRVPRIEIASKNGDSRREALVASQGGASMQSESYRTLRTNVIYARASRATREMLITSPGAKDGKSVTASNLAVTFAQQGRKTLLVDADLRRSTQHAIFDIPRRPGLSDLLAGQSILDEIMHETRVPNLTLIPAGATSPSPSELLSNPLLDYLLQRAREDFEAVIFDSPPMLAVTDATILAGRIDGVVMVVRAGQTHRNAASDALHQLRRVGTHLLGIVLNDAEGTGRYGGSYDYYRQYFEDAANETASDAEFTPNGDRRRRPGTPDDRVDGLGDDAKMQVVSRAETDRWLDALLKDE